VAALHAHGLLAIAVRGGIELEVSPSSFLLVSSFSTSSSFVYYFWLLVRLFGDYSGEQVLSTSSSTTLFRANTAITKVTRT
jgi:hypothetical protein